ncbi:MAG: hypothetical protein ACOVT5_04880 [Armatimonadaceae bacterium]
MPARTANGSFNVNHNKEHAMLRKREDEELNARQMGTTEESAIAMLSPDAEREIYLLYRDYFRAADSERQWNLWTDLSWDNAPDGAPSKELVDAALDIYKDLLFLPDYAAFGLARSRSSRGRAWFLTRWSYDEGKHLLTLNEWLVRRAGIPDSDLRAMGDALLTEFRWTPPTADPETLLADALAWEISEIARITSLETLATQSGEAALAEGCRHMLADDNAHRRFLAGALAVIAKERPEETDAAVRHVESHAPLVAALLTSTR